MLYLEYCCRSTDRIIVSRVACKISQTQYSGRALYIRPVKRDAMRRDENKGNGFIETKESIEDVF